jgi:hypothetical protein
MLYLYMHIITTITCDAIAHKLILHAQGICCVLGRRLREVVTKHHQQLNNQHSLCKASVLMTFVIALLTHRYVIDSQMYCVLCTHFALPKHNRVRQALIQ